jgi:uncharacterized protein (DUF362 family)
MRNAGHPAYTDAWRGRNRASAVARNARRNVMHHPVSRRHFLGVMGAAVAGMAAAACSSAPATAAPSIDANPIDTNSATNAGNKPKVAVAQAFSYDRAEVRKQVRAMLDALGGLKGVVKSRDRVVIKPNLTGGIHAGTVYGATPIESFITHPEVVRALAEAVKEAGAKEVIIVESVYEWQSFVDWGYEAIAKELGLTLVDLNQTAPFKGYTTASAGKKSLLFPEFKINPILSETDVFMSVAKMKTHATAGITLSMKNLVGMVPAKFYLLNPNDNHRSGLHGPDNEGYQRIPKTIVDLNVARPIQFALIDGIKTAEGGEGPWINGIRAKQANVLVAGVNALATDTVGTAIMGYDATAKDEALPFTYSLNHFALAAQAGLGTNKLQDIAVLGVPVNDVKTKFRPVL